MTDVVLGEEKFQREFQKIKSGLRKGNEPFWMSHGQKTPIAFLLIHGFTASPWEMRDLGKYLYNKGYNVYGMRQPGHATSPEDLLSVTWKDWYTSAEDAYELTALAGERVIIIGVSTGGTLALRLTAHRPEIAGVVSLAGMLFFQDWRVHFSGIGKYLIQYTIRSLDDKYKPYYYEKRAVSAIYELYRLTRKVKKELPNITRPVLLFHSRTDSVIKPESAEYIYTHIRSKNKKLILLDNAPHVLTSDGNPEQISVFDTINGWIKGLWPR